MHSMLQNGTLEDSLICACVSINLKGAINYIFKDWCSPINKLMIDEKLFISLKVKKKRWELQYLIRKCDYWINRRLK